MGPYSLVPESASTTATEVDHLYTFEVVVCTLMTLLIFACVFFFAIKYHRKSDDERPRLIHGSVPLEVAWSVLPFLVMLVMFAWGTKVYFTNYLPPRKDTLDIYVTGKQWMWKIQYPNGKREINELHVPVGRAVKLIMAS